MKRASPYTCDYCNTDKQPSNNWFIIQPETEVTVSYVVPIVVLSGFFLTRWDDSVADAPGVEHICGETCAVKALSKWMGQSR